MRHQRGKRSQVSRKPSEQQPRYQQIDMRDWLVWLDEARTVAVAAGREHRRMCAIVTGSLTWHALHARMLAAGLHELRDEPLFRAAKALYLQVECETAYGS